MENFAKDQLLSLLQKKEKEVEKAHYKISDLEFQLAQYKRIVHGQKRERFEGNKDQMSLPFEMEADQVQKLEEEVKEKLTYECRKRNSAHKGLFGLQNPAALVCVVGVLVEVPVMLSLVAYANKY